MEWVPGKPLAAYLEEGNRIELESVKRFLGDAAGAVDFAHDRKLIHGDLRPGKILVGEDGSAKVADLGLGLQARRAASKLAWGESIGSPAYLAPEQELGSALKESDIYSLGVVLYEMLTGHLPFEGPNFLAQKRELHYRRPSEVREGVPAAADAVVAKALEIEPQNRYHSAGEFYKAVS